MPYTDKNLEDLLGHPLPDLTAEQMAQITESLGGPVNANVAVGTARGETPGATPTPLQGLPKDQLAQLDRYSQLAEFGRNQPAALAPFTGAVALGVTGANELSKALPPIVPNTVGSIVNYMGGNGDQFKVDSTTSQPSFKNVLAAAKGYWHGLTRF